VFKKGSQPHINNFELGQHGRYRTNVWDYAGISSISTSRDEALAMHPTVKPVAMIADAIMDVSHRGDIVLDSFGGSGSTLIAAHETGRIARLVELDPAYCDVIIHRWQTLTDQPAVHVETGLTFTQLKADRSDGQVKGPTGGRVKAPAQPERQALPGGPTSA
jgi:DNA modification methylase